MALSAGTRLGAYDIVRAIGAGGMGEVYEARDIRLDRRVALKVIGAATVSRPESRDRFRREARAISQLQHPNICTLYDVGTHENQDFLVLEYLEGETLAARLERGPLPVAEALRVAGQITAALAAAHRRGIVHRDLKPGNVMLTSPAGARSGGVKSNSGAQVKLLDFGLAKAAAADPQPADVGTHTSPRQDHVRALTAEGALLGTYAYMAPEQIEGGSVDGRTDLWALGCVIYEMVTGTRPFDGKTPASLMGAVLKDEPPSLGSRQPLSPAALDQIVKTCLAKHPDDRFSSAHDVGIAINWLRDGSAAAAKPNTSLRRGRAVFVAGLVTVLAAGAGYLAGVGRQTPASLVWLEMLAPEGTSFEGPPAVSPDGQSVVFPAGGRLWLRRLNGTEPAPLPGTDGVGAGGYPFWSPDSRSIAFALRGQLSRLDLDANAPQPICEVERFRGGTWLDDDTLLFSGTIWGPILRVPARGGTPAPFTKLEKKGEGYSHRFPVAVPGGRFLYQAQTPESTSIWIASVSSPSDGALVVDARSHGEYAQGYLLFQSDGAVVAQRFDPGTSKLSGRRASVTPVVLSGTLHRYAFSASGSGTLGIIGERPERRQLDVVNRQGTVLRSLTDHPEVMTSAELSPDASEAAVIRRGKVVIIDVERRSQHSLDDVPEARSGEREPLWPPGGRTIFFTLPWGPAGNANIFGMPAAGGKATAAVPPTAQYMSPAGQATDGTWFWFGVTSGPGGGIDIFKWARGAEKPETFLETKSDEGPGRVSHDGQWLAYASRFGSESQVIVRNILRKDQWKQVSVSGGSQPRWRKDDRELFFVAPDGTVMAVDVATTPALKVGPPHELFRAELLNCDGYCYDVFPDGMRFLVNRIVSPGLYVMRIAQHWQGPGEPR